MSTHVKRLAAAAVHKVRRIEILREGATNDEVLKGLSDTDDTGVLTNKGMTHLRMQVVYLRTAYELAIQLMSQKTWKECCQLCIDAIVDLGTNYCKDKISIMKWNRMSRNKDTFDTPFNKERRT